MPKKTGLFSLLVAIATLALFLLPGTALARPTSGGGVYQRTNLVSNLPGKAPITDSNLVNPWGISYSPMGPFWISDNGTGLSTLYDGKGNIQPLVVTIPPPMGGTTSAPTGTVYNSNSKAFVVTENKKSGQASSCSLPKMARSRAGILTLTRQMLFWGLIIQNLARSIRAWQSRQISPAPSSTLPISVPGQSMFSTRISSSPNSPARLPTRICPKDTRLSASRPSAATSW